MGLFKMGAERKALVDSGRLYSYGLTTLEIAERTLKVTHMRGTNEVSLGRITAIEEIATLRESKLVIHVGSAEYEFQVLPNKKFKHFLNTLREVTL